jgi:hypothetical protein
MQSWRLRFATANMTKTKHFHTGKLVTWLRQQVVTAASTLNELQGAEAKTEHWSRPQ